ncbi:MAG: hypothetical protein ACP5D2_00645 [Candidatus Nanoarchaeia archaeon]
MSKINYKNHYQKIVDKLIEESFPELKDRRVSIIWLPSFSPLGTVLRGWKKDWLILPKPKKKQSKTKSALKGFLVHELSHILDLQRMSVIHSFIRYNMLNDLFIIIPKFNKFERYADKIAIQKGYAKELYENVVKVSKKYPKFIIDYAHSIGYLSPEQIKTYARKIGKW